MSSSLKRSRVLQRSTFLFLDFDGTLTVQDTMPVLGQLTKTSQTTWQQIFAAYKHDDAQVQKTHFPWKNHDRKEYSDWLASRKWVETRSAHRVQDANFFKGATLHDMDQAIAAGFASGSLHFRDGWAELFELFCSKPNQPTERDAQSKICVISVNWSATFIRRALYKAAMTLDTERQKPLCKYINDMEIYANEIDGLWSQEGSSGRVCRLFEDVDIRTSGDKLRYLQRVSKAKESNETGSVPPFTVYVGDSTTDFDCLCGADLGLWICNASETDYRQLFKDSFQPLNFVPPSLGTIAESSDTDALFYWVSNLHAVSDALTDG